MSDTNFASQNNLKKSASKLASGLLVLTGFVSFANQSGLANQLVKLDIIVPNRATGLRNGANDRLNSVYASDERNYAIMFALNILTDEKGVTGWSISWTPDLLEVIIETGKLDLTTEGYLYRLPSDSFRQVNHFQWVSDVPVKPLECEIIKPTDHLHWIHV